MKTHWRWSAQSTVIIALALGFGACKSAEGDTPEEKRADIRQIRHDVLTELYQNDPDLRNVVERSPGYAVFSNRSTKFGLFGSDVGYGMAVDNRTGEETFMRMKGYGAGLGMGVTTFRVVFVFHEQDVMRQFIDSGWDFGGQAAAAAEVDDTGAASGGNVTVESGMSIYRITDDGVALSATVGGTKYWKDDDLNS